MNVTEIVTSLLMLAVALVGWYVIESRRRRHYAEYLKRREARKNGQLRGGWPLRPGKSPPPPPPPAPNA